MSRTLTYTGWLIITSCWCGIELAIPSSLYDEAHRHGQSVYCPIGHTFVYSSTVEKDLEKERARSARLLSQLDQKEAELKHVEARRRAAKAAHSRTKSRIHNGVCPCCKRHFVDLERHMKGRHPDYISQEAR